MSEPTLGAMIDIETLGTLPESVVVSIGAVIFDLRGQALGPTFYAVLDQEQQFACGRTQEEATLRWWKKQTEEAQSVLSKQGTDVRTALELFSKFLSQYKLNVWANCVVFDICTLENLYRSFGVKIPWRFNQVRDFKTYVKMTGDGYGKHNDKVSHNALDDAIMQAKFLIGAL